MTKSERKQLIGASYAATHKRKTTHPLFGSVITGETTPATRRALIEEVSTAVKK